MAHVDYLQEQVAKHFSKTQYYAKRLLHDVCRAKGMRYSFFDTDNLCYNENGELLLVFRRDFQQYGFIPVSVALSSDKEQIIRMLREDVHKRNLSILVSWHDVFVDNVYHKWSATMATYVKTQYNKGLSFKEIALNMSKEFGVDLSARAVRSAYYRL